MWLIMCYVSNHTGKEHFELVLSTVWSKLIDCPLFSYNHKSATKCNLRYG